jgi:hypothetical protein
MSNFRSQICFRRKVGWGFIDERVVGAPAVFRLMGLEDVEMVAVL